MTPYWPYGEPIQVVTGPAARSTDGGQGRRSSPAECAGCASGETPQRFVWRGQSHLVAETGVAWRVHIAWWRDEEIWRDYWEVTTTTRLLCLIFHDLHSDRWGLERVWE